MASRTVGGTTTTYGYDARGLRVEKNGSTFYIFDGSQLLGEVSSSGTVEAAYTWGAAGLVSERLVPSDTSLWYGFGPQGETRLLTNSSGSVVDTYVYMAYGQPIASSGTDVNPFRYGGQVGYYTDASDTSGAVLCGLRWYDPNPGRWISRDPIGYDGGDNLYNYCDSNPVNWNDFSGTNRFWNWYWGGMGGFGCDYFL
jgi:RHS repeat-associated protein